MGRRRQGELVVNEQRVLATAMQLASSGTAVFHGYLLNVTLERAGGDRITISTLYRCLNRLEERGLLSSEYRPSVNGGPGTRSYSLTPDGLATARSLDTAGLFPRPFTLGTLD